jgi:cytochrome c556
MNRLHLSVAFAALSLIVVAAPLVASETSRAPAVARAPTMIPAQVVQVRVAGLKEMGAAFKHAMDGLRSKAPQMILIQQSARTIKTHSQSMYSWFPAGSGPQRGLKTEAKPEIWTKPAEFRAALDGLSRAADTFQSAAMAGNPDAVRAAARSLGGSCKTCHDQFRVPDHH